MTKIQLSFFELEHFQDVFIENGLNLVENLSRCDQKEVEISCGITSSIDKKRLKNMLEDIRNTVSQNSGLLTPEKSRNKKKDLYFRLRNQKKMKKDYSSDNIRDLEEKQQQIIEAHKKMLIRHKEKKVHYSPTQSKFKDFFEKKNCSTPKTEEAQFPVITPDYSDKKENKKKVFRKEEVEQVLKKEKTKKVNKKPSILKEKGQVKTKIKENRLSFTLPPKTTVEEKPVEYLDGLKCVLCKYPARNNRQCPHCDSLYCLKCLDSLEQRLCQKCKKNLPDKLEHNDFAENMTKAYPVKCQKCKLSVNYGKIEEHLKFDCVKMKTFCTLHSYGCKFKGDIHEKLEHLKVCPYVNVKILLEQFEKQENYYKKEIKNLNFQLSSYKKESTKKENDLIILNGQYRKILIENNKIKDENKRLRKKFMEKESFNEIEDERIIGTKKKVVNPFLAGNDNPESEIFDEKENIIPSPARRKLFNRIKVFRRKPKPKNKNKDQYPIRRMSLPCNYVKEVQEISQDQIVSSEDSPQNNRQSMFVRNNRLVRYNSHKDLSPHEVEKNKMFEALKKLNNRYKLSGKVNKKWHFIPFKEKRKTQGKLHTPKIIYYRGNISWSSGKHEFIVEIKRLSGHGFGIAVGLENKQGKFLFHANGRVTSSHNTDGYQYSNKFFENGDRIGVHFNLDLNSLSFSVNGIRGDDAFSNIKGKCSPLCVLFCSGNVVTLKHSK